MYPQIQIHHPPPTPYYVPPPVAPPAGQFPGHLIYDPASLLAQLVTTADSAFTAMILLCLWVGLAAGLGLILGALLNRYAGPGMAGRDALLTAFTLVTAAYVINGLPFWQGWPSVVALVTAITFAMMRLSPADPDVLSRLQGFWAGRLLAISPGRRQR